MHDYILPANRVFEPISCFRGDGALLLEHFINKGFYCYILVETLLHTPEIKLRTIWKLLRTRGYIVTYRW